MRRGVELNPNDSDGLAMLAQALCMQGKPDEAIAQFSEATRINPSFRPYRGALMAIGHFVARRYQESLEAWEELDDPPPVLITWYAAALAQLGREDDAKKVIADYRRNGPPYLFHRFLTQFKHDEDRAHYAEALGKAGLEEARDWATRRGGSN